MSKKGGYVRWPKLFFLSVFLSAIAYELPATTLNPEIADEVFWTSCGIQKYCTTAHTLSDEAYLSSQNEAAEILIKKFNLKHLTCGDIDSDLATRTSLVRLKVHIRSTTLLDEATCLSDVDALKNIELDGD